MKYETTFTQPTSLMTPISFCIINSHTIDIIVWEIRCTPIQIRVMCLKNEPWDAFDMRGYFSVKKKVSGIKEHKMPEPSPFH